MPAPDAPVEAQAVLWDLDGTLVDTEPYWFEVETALVQAHGRVWTHADALELVGSDLMDSARVLRDHGVDLQTEQIVDLLNDGVAERVRRAVPWRPGARELLADLCRHGVPCALVTMSYLRLVTLVLDVLPEGTFDVVVTGDAVTHGKPHPEPYLRAAALLGVEPSQCLAIEDSNTGATSAETAGCLVVVVENHVRVAPGERRVRYRSLEGLTLAELLSVPRRFRSAGAPDGATGAA